MDEPLVGRGIWVVLAGLAAGFFRWLVLFVMLAVLLIAGLAVTVAMRKERPQRLKPLPSLFPSVSR